jgi:hypothetical protein
MGYPGHPQQQQNWQGGGGYYPPQRQGSPAFAVITAILGLLMAGAFVLETVDLLSLTDGYELPTEVTAMIVAHFVIAGIAFIGAVLVFARVMAGAFVLLISSVLALGAVLTAPLIVKGIEFTLLGPGSYIDAADGASAYYKALFEFANLQATTRFMALALGAILLITAVLPPSLKWLRRPRRNDYSAQQAGW